MIVLDLRTAQLTTLWLVTCVMLYSAGLSVESRVGYVAAVFVGNERSRSPEAKRIVARWKRNRRIAVPISALAGLFISWRFAGFWWFTLPGPVAIGLASVGCYLDAHIRAKPLALQVRVTGKAVTGFISAHSFDLRAIAQVLLPLIAWLVTQGQVPADTRGDLLILCGLGLALGIASIAHRSAGSAARDHESPKDFGRRYRFWRTLDAGFFSAGMLCFVGALLTPAIASNWGILIARNWIVSIDAVLIFGALVLAAGMGNRFGQGGAFVEGNDGELSDPAIDNRKWIVGLIYTNFEDPRVWVERRTRVGMTLNHARPEAWLLIAAGYSWAITLMGVYSGLFYGSS